MKDIIKIRLATYVVGLVLECQTAETVYKIREN